jgi:cell division protein FtsZ
MVEYDRHTQRDDSGKPALRTCIVGIGGAGVNVLDRITLDRTVEAKLVCMHTDVRVLSHAMAPVKVQLGADLVRGAGAGGDPDLGREAAMFSREEIRREVEGHDIVFLCTGLGGGTGSGAAPVIAEFAKATGALVIVAAAMPFSFEGRRRNAQAAAALDQLQKRADALVLFENNRMGELILPKDGIQKAFLQADQLIAQSLRAICTIVTLPGLVKLGLDDLTAALSTSNGRCLFGFGEARGQNRGAEALKRALKSPLIDQGRLLHQTRTLLVHIAGGESLTLVEVDAVMKQLGRHVPDQTHILFGVAVDAKLEDSLAVTLISSLGLEQLNSVAAAAPPAEMLPEHNRDMPTMADVLGTGLTRTIVTPPPPAAPKAERAPEPPPVPAAEFTPEPPPPSAAVEPAPAAAEIIPEPTAPPPEPAAKLENTPSPTAQPASPPPHDLLFQDTEILAPAPKPATSQAAAAAPRASAAVRSTPEPDALEMELLSDFQAPVAAHSPAPPPVSQAQAPAREPTPLPPLRTIIAGETAPKPAERKPRIEDFLPAPEAAPHKALETFVASEPAPKPAERKISIDDYLRDEEPPVTSPIEPKKIASPLVAVKKPAQPQIDLGLGKEEDLGRFRGTEPALAAGGENLDVPTWKRLKMKLRRAES